MDEFVKFRRDVEKLTADERKAVAGLMRGVAAITQPKTRVRLVRAVADVAAAGARATGRRRSDRKTDTARRVTVGARLRRETAQLYRDAAEASGRTLYRFVVDALCSEYEKTTGEVCPDI